MVTKDCVYSECWGNPQPVVVVYGAEEAMIEPCNEGFLSWITRWLWDVVDDLRSTRWTQFAYGYLLALWFFFLFVLTTSLPAYLYLVGTDDMFYSSRSRRPAGCLPNDVFIPRQAHINVFELSGFFQITHGFGNLTFAQVKVVDIIWDVVSFLTSTAAMRCWSC